MPSKSFVMNNLLKGGLAAGATLLSYKWLASGERIGSPVELSPTATGVVTNLERSGPRSNHDNDLYCFYCGRGGVAEGNDFMGEKEKVSQSPGLNSASAAIYKSKRMLMSVMLKHGIPGCLVAVMVDGKCVWSEGVGMADVENQMPCTTQSGINFCKYCFNVVY